MSELDAFLDGIARDRGDRTRVLVFADWLAERDDPREEFVRLHARLLDMDGTEPGFEELERAWAPWARANSLVGYPQLLPPKLDDRWLDAFCRVCTAEEVAEYAEGGRAPEPMRARMVTFLPDDHTDPTRLDTLTLYHGRATDYSSPLEFVSETILADLPVDPFPARGAAALHFCEPLTRGRFWRAWREVTGALREPPPVPRPGPDNPFLAAQRIGLDWLNWGVVAQYQRDYFALVFGSAR